MYHSLLTNTKWQIQQGTSEPQFIFYKMRITVKDCENYVRSINIVVNMCHSSSLMSKPLPELRILYVMSLGWRQRLSTIRNTQNAKYSPSQIPLQPGKIIWSRLHQSDVPIVHFDLNATDKIPKVREHTHSFFFASHGNNGKSKIKFALEK